MMNKHLSIKSNFDYINAGKTESERRLRLAELTRKFESQSNFANFATSYVEDGGREDFLNEFENEFAAEHSLSEIKRLVIRADLEKTLVPQIQAKNAITKRNSQRKAEMQKEFQKNY